MSLDARLRHPSNPREQTYDGLWLRPRIPRQGRWNRHTAESADARLTGAGFDAANIQQDIITGTVMQRPGLNGLLNAVQTGDVLVGDRA